MADDGLKSGFRAVWLLVGIAALALHRPLTPVIAIALAAPWALVMALLARRKTADAVIRALRGAASTAGGGVAMVALLLAIVTAAFVLTVAAGMLLGVWLVAAAALVGVRSGPAALRQQLAGWALLAASVGLALVAAEGVLRVERVAERLGTPAEIGRWDHRYDRLWERNVLGIRSPYENLRKGPGVRRIVAIGDSFTWGDKIASSDSTWPARLEAELRDRLPGAELEVINLGRNGFTTVNVAEMLRRLGWQFDPDLVVIQFYLNDILPSGPDFERVFSQWLFPRSWIVPQRYRSSLLRRSALLDTVEGVITSLRHGDDAARIATWTELYQRRGPEWVALAEALEEMGSAAADRGVPIVLMLFPYFMPEAPTEGDLPFQAIHDQVTRTARDAGFSILDLTPAYLREGRDLRRWWATPYDHHPNEAAAGLAARVLADHLMTEHDLRRWSP
jgi:lysophospholipase L1-like esterase